MELLTMFMISYHERDDVGLQNSNNVYVNVTWHNSMEARSTLSTSNNVYVNVTWYLIMKEFWLCKIPSMFM
jgi:hypothetical protein